MRILVLGLGNELLGDDAVGLLVVRELRKLISGVDFKESNLMGIKLIDELIGYDVVFIIDSIKTGGEPGTVYVLDPDELKAGRAPSPHYTGVPEALELARALGMGAPLIVRIYAVEVRDPYTIRTGLSEELEKKLPEIVSKIGKMISEELKRLKARKPHG